MAVGGGTSGGGGKVMGGSSGCAGFGWSVEARWMDESLRDALPLPSPFMIPPSFGRPEVLAAELVRAGSARRMLSVLLLLGVANSLRLAMLV